MDLSVRYIKLAKPEVALALAVLFSGERGISHGDPQVRARAAYNLFKMTEAMEQRASSLLPLVPRFAGKQFLLECTSSPPFDRTLS